MIWEESFERFPCVSFLFSLVSSGKPAILTKNSVCVVNRIYFKGIKPAKKQGNSPYNVILAFYSEVGASIILAEQLYKSKIIINVY